MAQRLPEVFVVLVQAHLGRRIQQAAESDGGIDDQTRKIIGRRAEFALQSVVDHDGRGAQIRQENC